MGNDIYEHGATITIFFIEFIWKSSLSIQTTGYVLALTASFWLSKNFLEKTTVTMSLI